MFYEKINGDETIRTHKFLVWHELFAKIHELEMEGIDCLVDTNALTYVDREQFLDWFPGFEHHLIYIEADFELCCKNVAARRRSIPFEEMERMFEKLEEPCFDEDNENRWSTVTYIHNINNELQLKRIYMNRIGEKE